MEQRSPHPRLLGTNLHNRDVIIVGDQETLDDRLLRAEVLVRQADRQVVNQRRLVARIERNGEDSTAARALLAELEETRTRHIAEHDRLLREK
jgi:hypothetical protein